MDSSAPATPKKSVQPAPRRGLGRGLEAMTPAGAAGVVPLAGGGAILETMLTAISLGAVFMGAMSYIGNGPNFMVKSIAEQMGVKMPSFFGFMAYSVAILVPLFAAVTWIFL